MIDAEEVRFTRAAGLERSGRSLASSAWADGIASLDVGEVLVALWKDEAGVAQAAVVETPGRLDAIAAREKAVTLRTVPLDEAARRVPGGARALLDLQSWTGGRVVAMADVVRGMELDATVREAIATGRELGGGALPLTTSLLILAIARMGREDRAPSRTADLLRQSVNFDRLNAVVAAYIDARRAAMPMQPAPGATSLRAATALQLAAEVARSATGSPTVHLRHLLTAILLPSAGGYECGGRVRLREAGVSTSNIRARMFEVFVARGENDDAWLRWLADAGEGGQSLGFASDTLDGADLLDIERETRGIAAIITARDVSPPLAVGLFGDWGSGKSFFMRCVRLEVARLARRARESRRMQRDVPVWKYVAQIEFNAWHYVEGNLWASLVDHILRNLTAIDDDSGETERVQRRLLTELAFAKGDLATAQKELDEAHVGLAAAQSERERADTAIKAAAADLATAEAKLAREQARLEESVASQALHLVELPAVHAALAPTLSRLGIPQATNAANDLRNAISEAHATLNRASTVLLPALRGPDRTRRLLWLGASVLAGPLATLAANLVSKDGLSSITALTTFVVPSAAACTAWIRAQTSWISDRVKEVEAAETAYGVAMERKRVEREEALAGLRATIERLEKERDDAAERHVSAQLDVETATRNLDAAHRRVGELTHALEEITPQRLLARYLDDRTRSDDYRKHLGLVARIRADFEKISRLIEEGNWGLLPARDGDERHALTRFSTLEDEEKDAAGRINRIVLYIDDLDRCPPERVVEVLEAVHLLLAFQLFVVVVAVDVRWLSHALAKRYQGLLASEDGETEIASVHDYLEKIFQIPFIVRSLDTTGTKRILGGLAQSKKARNDDAARRSAAPVAPASAMPLPPPPWTEAAQPADTIAIPVASPQPDPTAVPAAAAAGDRFQPDITAGLEGLMRDGLLRSGGRTTDTWSTAHGEISSDEERLALLEIARHELAMMSDLAPLLCRSPRALKRFVNVFRLLKAGLRRSEAIEFCRETDPSHRAVLFLLAIEVGTPRIATRVLVGALRAPSAPKKEAGVPAWLRTALTDAESDPGAAADVRRVRDWMAVRGDASWEHLAPDVVRRWAGIVSRFSFSSRELTAASSACAASAATAGGSGSLSPDGVL